MTTCNSPDLMVIFIIVNIGLILVNMSTLAARVAQRCALHPWRVLSIALILSVLAAWATAHLPVYTSRQALLPKNNAVSDRFDRFLAKFGAASDLIVVVEGADSDVLDGYARELAVRLRKAPEIAQASDRVDMQFFADHAYLMAPPEQLNRLMQFLAEQPAPSSRAGKTEIQTLLAQAEVWLKTHPEPSMDSVDIKMAEAALAGVDFLLGQWQEWLAVDTPPLELDLAKAPGDSGALEGRFASRDGRMQFVFVHPAKSVEEFESLEIFMNKVKAASVALTEDYRQQGLEVPVVGFTGLPAIEYEEHINIHKDIILVVCTSAVLILLLILLVARSVRWALIIFVPMGLGVLWSLGLALFTVGHLTLITSGFIAILFGLGADYGIFTSSRIAEERAAGQPLETAIGRGIGASFHAVLTAGGASLLIFCALATVDFVGFSELGLIAAKGVLLILLSTLLVQPALYALLPPRISSRAAQAPASVTLPKWLRHGRYPAKLAGIIVGVALLTAALGLWRGFAIPFDYDVLALLPADSQAAHYQRRMVAESDYQAEVVIFTAPDVAEARRITQDAEKLTSFAKVQSIASLFPADAGARAAKAHDIARQINQGQWAERVDTLTREGLPVAAMASLGRVLAGFETWIDATQELAFSSGQTSLVERLESIRGRLSSLQAAVIQGESARLRTEMFWRAVLKWGGQAVNILSRWQSAAPVLPSDLPLSIHDRFFAQDGTVAVYAFPAQTVYVPENLDRLMKDAYQVSPEATGFPATHQMFAVAAVQGFVRGTLLAAGVCLLWIMLVVRRPKGVVLAALPLLIGGGWMLGLMYVCGISYNYANIIALPLVMALAVDYGVWFNHRWTELTDRTPFEISLISGRVIGLAAGTELAGLGAIMLAHYRGISSLGKDITLGLICCLLATFVVAPAIGQFLDRKRKS
ncbi:sterol transporter cytoplasmic membrane protein BstA [Candidatus Methylospira mobilis]|uniref:sterol transporter cytoplasmic membrane protein BstA n=1 Tax=Candidatus Methylospira mobilis TaxID=1808979 RepID=UPI001D174255|nr:sterol transporter cytoplasmic membrane protein BstA [Candidatus Methylospira mobilis]